MTQITGQQRFRFQLVDRTMGVQTGPTLTDAGGMILFCPAGTYVPAALQDINGNALANPLPLTLGGTGLFYTAYNATNPNLDAYCMSPDGQFEVLYNVGPDTVNEIPIDRARSLQVARIPFAFNSGVPGTERDTGIVLPNNALVLPDASIFVATLETAGAKTVSAGLLSSQTGGNATGFINAISTAAAGVVPAQSQATTTRGAFLGAGTLDKGFSVDTVVARNISVTVVTASVAVTGQIILPYLNNLPGTPKPLG